MNDFLKLFEADLVGGLCQYPPAADSLAEISIPHCSILLEKARRNKGNNVEIFLIPPTGLLTSPALLVLCVDFVLHNLLKLDNVLRKASDSLSNLLRCHGILIHHPPESVLRHLNFGNVHRLGLLGVKLKRKASLSARELIEKWWGNGQTVTSSQLSDFVGVTERSTHDNGIMAMFFVVVVDGSHRHYTRIFRSSISLHALRLLVPIHDTSNKGRDERASSFGTRDSLRNREDERQVASNTKLLQHFGSLNTLPRSRDLNENALLLDAYLLVHFDQLKRLCDGGVLVKGQTSIDFRRDISGYDFGDLGTKRDSELVHGDGHISIAVGYRLVNDAGVFFHHGRLVDETGVGSRILGSELLDGVEVTGVTHDGGQLIQTFDLGYHGCIIICK
mmetsp:Transcript_20753/g.45062  ORF Transcript_20753/g.45062 Transcript_20753/m.45062 type:complete len:390 (-) Transcript_20753:165-1334(-)